MNLLLAIFYVPTSIARNAMLDVSLNTWRNSGWDSQDREEEAIVEHESGIVNARVWLSCGVVEMTV